MAFLTGIINYYHLFKINGGDENRDYEFGRIRVDGREYRSDVIIFRDHVGEGWMRREGHKVYAEDLEEILKEKPELLVIGTGYFGRMTVSTDTREYLKNRGIELETMDTRKAVEFYNRVSGGRKVITALHLTC